MKKSELQAMINEAITNVVIKEIKPLIRKTIKQEFYKIIDEVGEREEKRQMAREPNRFVEDVDEFDETDLRMSTLLSENEDEDKTRQQIGQKIFGEGHKFADILNQTAQQYAGRPGVNSDAVVNEQKEFVLNTTSMENPQLAQSAGQALRPESFGYGDGFKKVGAGDNIPGITGTSGKKSLKQIVNKPVREDQPAKVSLPTTSPDGRPIDFTKVPQQIVQNMMKNYSGLLNKANAKAKSKRPV